MKKPKIGIIGNGFVGEAQAFAFSTIADVLIYDINPHRTKDKIDEIHQCDFVFVCVPTPMKQNDLKIYHMFRMFLNSSKTNIYIKIYCNPRYYS